MSVSAAVNARLEKRFAALGRRVGAYPWAFIACSVSVALVAGSGIAKMETESDYFALWYPRKSQAWTDWKYQKQRFGPEKRVQSLVAEARAGSIFDKAALLDVLRLHHSITNGTRWAAVCERAWAGGPCKARSLLHAWGDDAARLRADEDILGTLSAAPLYDEILEEYMSLDALAAKTRFDGARALSATAVQIVYYVDDSLNSEDASRATLDFEEHFIDACWDDFESELVDAYCVASSSYKQLSDGEIDKNSIFVSSAMGVMVVYVTCLLFRFDAVRSRALLGGTIVLTVGLALLFALGVCGWVGVPFSVLSFLSLFIILGVGIDDMIIVVDARVVRGQIFPENNDDDAFVGSTARSGGSPGGAPGGSRRSCRRPWATAAAPSC